MAQSLPTGFGSRCTTQAKNEKGQQRKEANNVFSFFFWWPARPSNIADFTSTRARGPRPAARSSRALWDQTVYIDVRPSAVNFGRGSERLACPLDVRPSNCPLDVDLDIRPWISS